MIKQIHDCQKCGLCINQKPLLDTEKRCQVFWVGLSAKKAITDTEIPLSPETNTGMLIQKIENLCCNVVTYKTNLVKCLPLTEQQKLRYPNKKEIDSCFGNLLKEIHTMSPKIVFLLGEKVYSSVGKHLNIDFEKWNDFEYKFLGKKPSPNFELSRQELYVRVEAPKGELGIYLVGDDSLFPWRWKIRPPGFINLQILPQLVKKMKLADIMTILGSIDIIMGEVDR